MKNKDGLILGIIGGVAFGFTAGVGFILAQKTMAKVGTRGGAEHSEMLGGRPMLAKATSGQTMCRRSDGTTYPCGEIK
jgi:hypothetical protein